MKRIVTIALVAAVVGSSALIVRMHVDGRTPATTVAGAVPAAAVTPSQATHPAVPVAPKPADFTATVKPLATTCGLTIRPAPELADQRIAHCRVTYRTTVTYHGTPLPPSAAYRVSYDLVGTVNGSEPYSFTWTGSQVRQLPVQTGVPSPGVTLSAIPNDVERLP